MKLDPTLKTILEFENNRDKLDYLKALIKRLGG